MTENTTAAVRAAIVDWYTIADQSLGLMRHLAMQADDQMIHSVSSCVNDADDPPTKEHVDQLFAELLNFRKAKVSGLRKNADYLWSYLGSLNSFATGPIWPRYEIAYFDLGDFRIGNYSGGRSAAAVLLPLGYDVRRWVSELADLWSVDIVDAANTKLVKAFEDIRRRCPFTTEIGDVIQQRLMLEKSRLLQDFGGWISVEPQAKTDAEKAKRGGRKPAKETREEKKIKAAWDSGSYATYFDCDRGLGLEPGTTKTVIDRLKKRCKRRTK